MTSPHVTPRRVAEIVLDLDEWNALFTLAALGMALLDRDNAGVHALGIYAERVRHELSADRWEALQRRAMKIGAATWPELRHDLVRIFPQGHGR